MVTGKTAHIMMVIAAWSQMDDPDEVGGRRQGRVRAVPPHAPGLPTAPGLGHWLGGVAKNIPDDRKRGDGGVPALVPDQGRADCDRQGRRHPDQRREPIAIRSREERKYRWMKPLAEALQHAVSIYQFPEASEVIAVLELGLNQAVAGEITAVQALNGMADQIHARDGEDTATRPASCRRCAEDGDGRGRRAPRAAAAACRRRSDASRRRDWTMPRWRWATLGAGARLDAGAQRPAARQSVLDELPHR